MCACSMQHVAHLPGSYIFLCCLEYMLDVCGGANVLAVSAWSVFEHCMTES